MCQAVNSCLAGTKYLSTTVTDLDDFNCFKFTLFNHANLKSTYVRHIEVIQKYQLVRFDHSAAKKHCSPCPSLSRT